MGKPIINMIGKKINRLLVIDLAKKSKNSTQTGKFWLCKCDCGNEVVIDGRAIRSGKTKSCGCYKRDSSSASMKKMRLKQSGTIEDRFLSRFKKGKKDDCWNWLAHLDKDGYGILPANGPAIRAHRYSFEHYNNTIPVGMNICHKCDNPSCVNPHHLFLGTGKDNVHDMLNKRRDAIVGSKNNKAKLSEIDILKIRKSNKSTQKLMIEYGVSKSTINRVKAKKTWRHVDD